VTSAVLSRCGDTSVSDRERAERVVREERTDLPDSGSFEERCAEGTPEREGGTRGVKRWEW
jgi:hypothetical protein